jgi:alginate O-acetyltransferase complex protein AlgI
MWSLAFALFFAAKWLTWRATTGEFAGWRGWAYWFGWPGMDSSAFLRGHVDKGPELQDWISAGCNVALGAMLFWGVGPCVGEPLARGWLGMIGLVLMLHFGLFRLVSCSWRSQGVDAEPIMDGPLAAESVGDFWGRRWNRAFRDLTHRFLFRPLSVRLGPRWALIGGFVVSGLIHELVISVPAGAGYGLPTAYFCIQALGVLAERSALAKRWRLRNSWRGRLFTFVIVILPVMLLFHPPFVQNVIVPMMDAWGAKGD